VTTVFVVNWAQVIEIGVAVSPLIVIGLQNLEHNKYVAQSQALMVLVKGCELVVNDMDADLSQVPAGSGSEADVIHAAITTLRAGYVETIDKLGGTAVVTDDFLKTLLQQVRLPGGAQALVTDFFNGGAMSSGTVSGGNKMAAILRRNTPMLTRMHRIL
jgi:hypothetical protein